MNAKRRAAFAVIGVLLGVGVGGACMAIDESSRSTATTTTAPAAADLGDPVAATEDTDAADSDADWLFSHTSDGGTISPGADGTVVLTLTGIDEHVVAFTDRPDRQSEILDVGSLVAAWPSLFADSAPNAVLVEHDPSGTESSVLELTDPVLDGTTLRFTARVLEVEAADGLTSPTTGDATDGAAAGPASPPATFRAASLFIDDVDMGASNFDCVNGAGVRLTPPGQVPLVYRPFAEYAALCTSLGGTVITD